MLRVAKQKSREKKKINKIFLPIFLSVNQIMICWLFSFWLIAPLFLWFAHRSASTSLRGEKRLNGEKFSFCWLLKWSTFLRRTKQFTFINSKNAFPMWTAEREGNEKFINIIDEWNHAIIKRHFQSLFLSLFLFLPLSLHFTFVLERAFCVIEVSFTRWRLVFFLSVAQCLLHNVNGYFISGYFCGTA